MTDSSNPNPSSPESISMKRVLVGAALLSMLSIGVWMILGTELRGYGNTFAPGGVTITRDKSPTTSINDAATQQHMNEGVSLLYEQGDPTSAAGHFAQVLAMDSNHYGARYQIAKALDRSGQLRLAHRAWKQFEPLATKSKDKSSLAQAEKRIALLETRMASLEEQMKTGVDLLHVQKRAAEALPYFEALRKEWPTHYGAQYQYALALEHSGQGDAAEKAWLLFLAAAEESKIKEDIQRAQDALARVRSNGQQEPG